LLVRSLLRRRNGCDNGAETGGDVIVELKDLPNQEKNQN